MLNASHESSNIYIYFECRIKLLNQLVYNCDILSNLKYFKMACLSPPFSKYLIIHSNFR